MKRIINSTMRRFHINPIDGYDDIDENSVDFFDRLEITIMYCANEVENFLLKED